MAAFTNLQMLALEAPELSGASLTKNGLTISLTDYFQSLLDTNNDILELALAMLFEQLTSEDRNESLRLGELAFKRRTGMSFDDRRYYWERKYRGKVLFAQQGVKPVIGSNGPGYGYAWGFGWGYGGAN